MSRSLGRCDPTGTAMRETSGPNFRLLLFNPTSAMLKDPKIRKAIGMTVNRQAIASSDLQGLNWPAKVLNNHFYTEGQPGFQDNAGPLSSPNVNGAKQLLDADGWKMGSGGFREKNGKKLEIKLVIPAQVSVSANEGQLMRAMLQQVGIKLDINTVPSNDFFDKFVTPGAFDLTVYSWIGGAFPISGNSPLFFKPTKDAKGNLVIGQNNSRYGTDQIDTLMNKALTDLDAAQGRKDINAADKLIFQAGMMLTLYQRPNIVAVDKNVVNYGATAFQTTDWTKVGFHK